MKILIVNTFDLQGGAARASYRLHRSLLAEGVDSQMLVQRQSSDDFTIISNQQKVAKALASLRPTVDYLPLKFYKNRAIKPFSIAWLGWSGIVDKINQINPDIVHLHWIHEAMLGIKELEKIKAPIVWSLHDMWAFTGGCHYTEGCESFRESCGNCHLLASHKKNDLSFKIFKRKKSIYECIENMTIVGLSSWIHNEAKESKLLKDKQHIHLPNPIDTSIFKPFSREKARELWNLPQDKKLIMFGSMGAKSDKRKGFSFLYEALKEYPYDDVELVVLGSSEPKVSQEFGFNTHYIGTLHDDISLVTLYGAIDVLVVPSIQENLSNMIMESLACATPVIAFDIGGNGDMIEHKRSGYLAKDFSSEDLANGILWVLSDENIHNLSINARQKVLKEFDSRRVGQKYIELYKEILSEK